MEICDRKEAIAYAIHHGEPGDIIVLAGKGHEDYQEIKGKKYPMDERVLIAEILKEDQRAEINDVCRYHCRYITREARSQFSVSRSFGNGG